MPLNLSWLGCFLSPGLFKPLVSGLNLPPLGLQFLFALGLLLLLFPRLAGLRCGMNGSDGFGLSPGAKI